jgi:hypothetical protein
MIISGSVRYLVVLRYLTHIFDRRYSDAGISAVAFRPGKNMVVSSSFGGNFKMCLSCQLCG